MSGFIIKRAGSVAYLACTALEGLAFITHAFSTRQSGISPFPSGALNLSYIPEDTPGNVAHNRSRFLTALEQTDTTLITLRQIHSNQIHILNKDLSKTKFFLSMPDRADPDPSRFDEGDGLATDQPGYLLGIQTADCLPIILVDPRRRVVANIHAGWRGTQRRIVQHGIEALQRAYGSRPEDLIAVIGPGIGVCCYEVGDEVIEAFRNEFPYADACLRAADGAGRAHLDLVAANMRQLGERGLSENQIHASGRCTACETAWFFSHRREKGWTGRMLSIVGLMKG